MEVVKANPYGIDIIGRQQVSGETDYVKDGVLYRGTNSPSVMVESKSQLDELTDIYTPGTVAFTAGLKNMWQLSPEGKWEAIIEESEPAEEADVV